MGKLAEAQVPALAPKLAYGFRKDGARHDGSGADAIRLPEERYQMKTAEVQEKDETEKADPSAKQGLFLRNAASDCPNEQDAQRSLRRRPEPFLENWPIRVNACIEERIRVHAGPGQEIGE